MLIIFVPKRGVTCNRSELSEHDGYYWLAYDWRNFRLSCQRCNRPEKDGDALHGKANEFSLVDESQRCWNSQCLNQEEPLLLDPCVESDTRLLNHLINGIIVPDSPEDSVEFQRANYTCEVLGLNKFKVPEKKTKLWGPLNLLIEMSGNIENPAVTEQIRNYISGDAEYSCYFKSALKTHRDKDWVEALL